MMNTIHQRYDREDSTAGSYIQKFRFRCNILLELTNTQLCCLMHTCSESCSRINVQYLLILIFRFHFFPGRDNQQIIYIELVKILLPVIDPVNIFCFRYHNRAFSNIQEGFQILQLSLHTCHYRICIYGLSKKLHRSIFFFFYKEAQISNSIILWSIRENVYKHLLFLKWS